MKNPFWERGTIPDNLRYEYGIYVFYRRVGKRFHPLYVGRAYGKLGFDQEIFTTDKIDKFNNAIHPPERKHPYKGEHGFFLALDRPTNKSGKKKKLNKSNKNAIDALEDYLIHQGYVKNPLIQNNRGAKSSMPNWEIDGMKGKGRKSSEFKFYNALFQTTKYL